MTNANFKTIRAAHPHWRSDLYLYSTGKIVKHALFDIIGSYIESGQVLIVDWQNAGVEEFININGIYYHTSVINSFTRVDTNLFFETELTGQHIHRKEGTQHQPESVIKLFGQDSISEIRLRYDNIMKLLLHKGIPVTYSGRFSKKNYANFPVVSVVIPTKNRAKFLREAINSVLFQSYKNIEIIVVDDDSADNTREMVAEFSDIPAIKYVHASCGKSTSARNVGIKQASGKYIAYLDDDNIWFPTFLSSAVSYLERNRSIELIYGILVFDNNIDSNSLYIYEEYDRSKLLMENYIDTNVIVHRTSMLKNCNGWDENLSRLGDWDFVLSNTTKHNTSAIPVLGAYYRTTADQRNTAVYDLEKNAKYIIDKHGIS